MGEGPVSSVFFVQGRLLSHVRSRLMVVEMPLVPTNDISMVVLIYYFLKNPQNILNAQEDWVDRGAMQQSNGVGRDRGKDEGDKGG